MLRLVTPAALFAWLTFAACGVTQSDDRSGVHHDRQHTDTGFVRNKRVQSLPLAVKSPYLSAWLPVGSGEPNLAGRRAQFWNGHELEWSGLIRVNGATYGFLGDPNALGVPAAKQTFSEVQQLAKRGDGR